MDDDAMPGPPADPARAPDEGITAAPTIPRRRRTRVGWCNVYDRYFHRGGDDAEGAPDPEPPGPTDNPGAPA